MTEILIFGAGFLGQRFASELNAEEAGAGGSAGGTSSARTIRAIPVRVDITDREAVRSCLREYRPSAVINAAGRTGRPNVDWAETHPIETYRPNVIGALHVAEACAEAGVYLLHIGSGCVYYGLCPFREDGWHETDHANPSAFYTRTKYAADLVLSQMPGVGIARIRLPLDGRPHERNLITKIAQYKSVIDVENSVTVVDDLVYVTRELISRRASGIFHVTNPGKMRHKELVRLYRELVDPAHSCEFITEEQLLERGLAAKVRSNTVLASPRLAALGITMRPIDVALPDTMRKYAEAVRTSRGSPPPTARSPA